MPRLLLVAFVLSLAGCPGPLRPREEGDPSGEPPLSQGPPAEVVPVEGATARRLAAGLERGDRIVREAKLRVDMTRVGEAADLPAGELVASKLSRTRRYEDEVLEASQGRPTSVRRTYYKSYEAAEVSLSGGRVQKKEGSQAVEGVRVKLTEEGGRLRVESEELPPGVTEGDLDEVLVLDTVALGAFVPGGDAKPGDEWTVPIERIADMIGKQPPGATYAGSIRCRYARTVRYRGEGAPSRDGTDCAHIALVIDLDQRDRQEAGVPFTKRTKMILEGEVYFAFDEGRPLFLSASGPATIEYTPQGEAPDRMLARPFTLQGEFEIAITFESVAG